MLTDVAARKAKPKEKPYKLADSGGLYLWITPAGGKFWRLKYRYGGKEKSPLSIGPYPDVSLVDARQARDDAKRLLREGVDPAVEKRQRIAGAVDASDDTFEKIAREWHGVKKSQWDEVHADDVITSLENLVFPTIGSLPIRSIKEPLVLSVLRDIEARPAVETARRVRQRISAVFVYAIATGRAEADPAAVVKDALVPVVRTKQPAITELEALRAMMRTVEVALAHPATKLANRFLALTAVRSNSMLLAPWTEMDALDPSDPIWRIPPARMKLARRHKSDETREHWVPLSRQAVDCLAVLRKVSGTGRYVFPNTRHVHRPMSENAIGYLLNRNGYYQRHVPHGWRASFSTIMNERHPEDSKIIDLMLAHTPKDKVEAAYNRAEHIERRKELAQLWADYLLDGFPPAEALLEGPRR